MRIQAIVVLVLLACTGAAAIGAQPPDLDRELEEAKALYREAKFAQAIGKLHAVIGRLEQLRDLQARRIRLSDAHLHLALSYVALNDPTAAKESLKQMLRADRNRRLDPDVYAPKVIELFEAAKKEVAAEPAVAATPPPSATAKKGGSKAPLILLGAAAAAGGGIAVAKGGGGTTGAAPAATPTPTPTPVVSGSGDIVLLQSSPPPGSTVLVGRGDSVQMTFSVAFSQNVQDVIVRINIREGSGVGGLPCLYNKDSLPFSLTAGQAQSIPVLVPFATWDLVSSGCALPITVTEIRAWLQHGTCGPPSRNTACISSRPIAVSYNVVQ